MSSFVFRSSFSCSACQTTMIGGKALVHCTGCFCHFWTCMLICFVIYSSFSVVYSLVTLILYYLMQNWEVSFHTLPIHHHLWKLPGITIGWCPVQNTFCKCCFFYYCFQFLRIIIGYIYVVLAFSLSYNDFHIIWWLVQCKV